MLALLGFIFGSNSNQIGMVLSFKKFLIACLVLIVLVEGFEFSLILAWALQLCKAFSLLLFQW